MATALLTLGTYLSSSALNAHNFTVVRKPRSQARSSQDKAFDADLFVSLEPNSTYEVHAQIGVTGSASADINLSWGVPIGTVSQTRFIRAMAGTATSGLLADMRSSAMSIWTQPQQVGVTTSGVGITEEGIITTGDRGGTFGLRWAQWTTVSGTPTKVLKDSYLKIRKLA